jgi:tetratricopeptide (TPR) repeat protein
MYYALTGEPPCLGENVLDTLQRQIHDDPKPMTMRDPDLPPDLEAVIMKALRKNPDDRYQTVNEVLTDLREVAAGRQRVYATVQMKKPDLTRKKQPILSHNFETNMIVVLTLGAMIIAMTAYMTGRYVEEVGEARELNMWVDRNHAGDRARKQGKLTDAERYYKEAVSEAMKFGRNDPRLAKSLVSLGGTYLEDKQYERAETQLKRASGVLEKCYGQNCAELAPVLMLLARDYDEQGRKKEAAAAKSRALSLLDPTPKTRAKT